MLLVVRACMLKTQMKRFVGHAERATRRLAEIENSIANLAVEDLLDLADIFKAAPHTPLGEIAFAEMARRNVSL